MVAGNSLSTFQLGKFKIGLGICHDIRFPEMAELYRQIGTLSIAFYVHKFIILDFNYFDF